MKNKNSLKNLKQYRVRSKFVFYVLFRPIAQKWFFPVVGLILLVGILKYESEKEWVFTNPKLAAVEAYSEVSGQSHESPSVTQGVEQSTDDPMAVKTKTKGGAAPVASQVEVIKKVAEKEGIDWKILYALFKKETQLDCNREGDKQFIKPSWGCYQINKHYHPEVTWEQATDLEWSSNWTAKRLKAKAEKYGWDNAIAMHNGSPSNPVVQAYLADVKAMIESL